MDVLSNLLFLIFIVSFITFISSFIVTVVYSDDEILSNLSGRVLKYTFISTMASFFILILISCVKNETKSKHITLYKNNDSYKEITVDDKYGRITKESDDINGPYFKVEKSNTCTIYIKKQTSGNKNANNQKEL